MNYKFQIKEVRDLDKVMVMEVLDGSKVVLTKEFPITHSLEMSNVRTELAREMALIDERTDYETKLKDKIEKLKLQLNKKQDL